MKALVREQHLSKIFFLALAALVLCIVPLYRYFFYDGYASQENTYFHMRMSETIFSGIFSADPAVVMETSYFFDPFDALLGISRFFIGTHAALLLPFILGIITLFFVYLTIAEYIPSAKQQLIAGIFLLSCPLTITLFTHATSYGFIAFLMSAGIYFYNRKTWLAYIILPLLCFYSLYHSIVAILFLLLLKKKPFALSVCLVILAGIFSFLRHDSFQFQIPSLLILIQQLFSDFGSSFGLSIFGILLACFGLSTIQKKELWIVLCISILFIFVSPLYAIYFIPLLAYSASYGFFSLLERQWSLSHLQNIAVLLLILGILFSATSMISRIAQENPTPLHIQGLVWLGKNIEDKTIILTDKQYGFMAEYFTHQQVLFDKNTPVTNIPLETSFIFYAKNPEQTTTLLDRYHIDYIIIFSETPHAQLSNYLLTKENFKKIFENSEITIWKIEGPL